MRETYIAIGRDDTDGVGAYQIRPYPLKQLSSDQYMSVLESIIRCYREVAQMYNEQYLKEKVNETWRTFRHS